MDSDSDTPRPKSIIDDTSYIAERMKQIRKEEGRGEKQDPEAQGDTYWGSGQTNALSTNNPLPISFHTTIGGVHYRVELDESGTTLHPVDDVLDMF